MNLKHGKKINKMNKIIEHAKQIKAELEELINDDEKAEKLKSIHSKGKYNPEKNDKGLYVFWTYGSTKNEILMRTTKHDGQVEYARMVGLCCKTSEEAQSVVKNMKLKQKILDRIEELNKDYEPIDWGDNSQRKWFFILLELNEILLDYHYSVRILPDSSYATSPVIMQKVQEEFGDEAIINAFQLN